MEKHRETVRDFLAVFDVLEHIVAGSILRLNGNCGDPTTRKYTANSFLLTDCSKMIIIKQMFANKKGKRTEKWVRGSICVLIRNHFMQPLNVWPEGWIP